VADLPLLARSLRRSRTTRYLGSLARVPAVLRAALGWPMIVQLRPYQEDLVREICRAWSRHRRVLAWMPTGAGKTEISVYLAERLAARGGCTLFVVERRTLAKQGMERFSKYGLLVGLLRGTDTFVRGYEPVLVASIQTLVRRWDRPEIRAALERVRLVVIDEAHIQHMHHIELLNRLPECWVLGVTATPLRDGLGLTYDALVKGPSYADLIALGHLVPPRYFLPHIADVEAGLRSVGVASTGDYVLTQLSALMRQRAIVGDITQTWLEKAQGRRTIAFCVDLPHSRSVCDAFRAAGVCAEQIDMYSGEEDRASIFRRFRSGETLVLTSVGVLGVGYDEPLTSCAVLARPTLSLSLHIQQVGRILRAAPEKADAAVHDHAGNVLRHGKVEGFDPPELSAVDKASDKSKEKHAADYFPCPECRALMEPGQRVCGECGHEVARRNTVHFLPGALVQQGEDRKEMTRADLRDLYLELRYIAAARGKDEDASAKRAYAQVRGHFDFQCPYSWRAMAPKVPSARTLNLECSWRIAFAKARARERGGTIGNR
jgi:DNA repair protein RadD